MNDSTTSPVPLKRCSKCSELKPATSEFFHVNMRAVDGFQVACKQCRSKASPETLEKQHEFEQLQAQGLKRCTKCQEIKAFEAFSIDRGRRDGLQNHCRDCLADPRTLETRRLMEEGLKQCLKCGEIKPLTIEFFAWRNDRQVWDTPCKECQKVYHAEYYDTNGDYLREYSRQYGVDHREEISARNKQKRIDNPEEAKARSKRNYWSRRDASLQYSREYRETHKEELSARRKARYEQVKDKINARKRAEYAENPEPIRARNRDARLRNLEKYREYGREYSRRYAAQHPEVVRAYKNAWKQRNPMQRRAEKLRRRARIRNLPNTFTTQDWHRAVEYFGGRCAACGRQGKDLFGTHTLAGDHWIPLASPLCPGTVPTNLVPLCHGEDGCNSTKHAIPADVWAERRFGKRKSKEVLARIQAYFEWVASQ